MLCMLFFGSNGGSPGSYISCIEFIKEFVLGYLCPLVLLDCTDCTELFLVPLFGFLDNWELFRYKYRVTPLAFNDMVLIKKLSK